MCEPCVNTNDKRKCIKVENKLILLKSATLTKPATDVRRDKDSLQLDDPPLGGHTYTLDPGSCHAGL